MLSFEHPSLSKQNCFFFFWYFNKKQKNKAYTQKTTLKEGLNKEVSLSTWLTQRLCPEQSDCIINWDCSSGNYNTRME